MNIIKGKFKKQQQQKSVRHHDSIGCAHSESPCYTEIMLSRP